jgi:RNA 2',3'-cyclic 3'-phosphodiesterase
MAAQRRMHVIIGGQLHGGQFCGSGLKFQVLNHARRTATVKRMTEPSPPAFLRLFIALAVPPEVREEIGRAQGLLRRNAPPGAVRWTRPEQFHITLKFLGDVPAEQLDALKKSVAEICAVSRALRLSARGIGFFPSERKPRVIWAGTSDANGQLSELHWRLDEALRCLAPAERPEKFTGHITLGRFKPGHHAAIPKLLELAADLRARHFGDWQALELEIVRSELTVVGAEHAAVAAFPLAA